jgi:hypothetical protein
MKDTMTCTEFEALLPRLLDEELEMPAAARRHIDDCDACRSLFADLGAIRSQAANLPALQPNRDLWNGIEERIQSPVVPLATGAGRGRGQLSWRAAGIAAAALIGLTSAITYRVARRFDSTATQQLATVPSAPLDRPETAPTTVVAATNTQRPMPTPSVKKSPASRELPGSPRVTLTSAAIGGTVAYDREIARLRAILDSGRTRLDPATVALLERNLTVIDSAIVQCRRALVQDPASEFLIESLNNSYQTKVKLLRIAAAASKG